MEPAHDDSPDYRAGKSLVAQYGGEIYAGADPLGRRLPDVDGHHDGNATSDDERH